MCENSLDKLVHQQNSEVAEDSTSEEIRKKYINHEASVKSIGFLYFLGAFFLIVAGVIGLIYNDEDPLVARIFVATLLICLGLFQLWVGRGLRTLKSWARIPTGILSGIGLLGFPIGTIINGYILYLVFCKKGSTVFSPEYQQVIAATPNIKYKTPIIIWILLGLLIFILGLGLISLLFSS